MKTTYHYDHYYLYDEITSILSGYAENHPELVRLVSIGTTPHGRDIWAVELTDTSSGDFSEKPGFALDGNVHAGEVTGSMACMYFLDVLLTNRDEPEIRSLLENYTIYCVPRISPDGSEFYLTTPYSVRSSDRMFPYAEEQAGIQPEDLDGDGVIRRMRVKNPNGQFKVSPENPRLMVRRRPDETEGTFYDVFSEGVLKGDQDELLPAPERYGEDFNRNFPGWWGVGGRGGAYGLSAPETRAFADFLFSHKNICTCLNFHTYGGMYLYPPAFQDKKDAAKEDMERYREIGKVCTEATGYPFVNLHDDYIVSSHIGGSIDDFGHFVLGIISFTCECWNIEERSGHPHVFPSKGPRSDEEMAEIEKDRMKWFDENTDGSGWSDWKEFEHPQLGKVEIGGFDFKRVIQNPPAVYLEEEIKKHTDFMLKEIRMLPRLVITELSSKTKDGLSEVTLKIANSGYLPTNVTAESLKIGHIRPLKVIVEGGTLLGGRAETEIGHLNGYALTGTLGNGRGGTTVNHLPQSKTLKYTFLTEDAEVKFTVVSERAGTVSRTIKLNKEEE